MSVVIEAAHHWHYRTMVDLLPMQAVCDRCASQHWQIWTDGHVTCAACGSWLANCKAMPSVCHAPSISTFWKRRDRVREVLALPRNRAGEIMVVYRWRYLRGDWRETRCVQLSTWNRWAFRAELIR